MKRGKSISALSVFSRFKSPECTVDAQGALASATHRFLQCFATPISVSFVAIFYRAIRPTENTVPPAEPPSSSKSPLSILKLFVNKIRLHTGITEMRYIDTAVQERREAALRERGLLPPLERNKDRERERDQHLPIIEDPSMIIPRPGGAQLMTPAIQIKKEWEAQKGFQEEEERERLNRFRFGTQSTSVNETRAHGQPSGASAMSVPVILALSSSCASTDEDTIPPALGASGPPKHRSSIDDSSLLQAEYPTNHIPTLIPITPLLAPLHACSVSPLPPRTPLVIQARFEPELPWCPPVPLETTPSVHTPHIADLPVISTSNASLQFSSVKGIPAIVESLIEDGLSPEAAILNSDTETQQIQRQYPKSKRRKRRMVFSEDQSRRRLAITTSLSNMRRSITSTLMRTRSGMVHKGLNGDGAQDALSHQLRTTQLTSARSLDALTAPRRRAVAPTIHSQGSILFQTSAIEDEEARRVAELAYLG